MSILQRIRALFGGTSPEAEGDVAPEGGEAPMISCHEALQVVQEYLDGELDTVSGDRVRAHFEVCQRCYPHLRFESSFREAVKRAGAGESAPDELRSRVSALIAEARSEG